MVFGVMGATMMIDQKLMVSNNNYLSTVNSSMPFYITLVISTKNIPATAAVFIIVDAHLSIGTCDCRDHRCYMVDWGIVASTLLSKFCRM